MADSDLDGLSDSVEISVHQTNPNNEDTDSDGLNDGAEINLWQSNPCLLYTSPSPRDRTRSRMPSSA